MIKKNAIFQSIKIKVTIIPKLIKKDVKNCRARTINEVAWFIPSVELLIITFETIRLIKTRIIYFLPVFIFLIIGSITPGFAPLFRMINLNLNIKKLYRNS